MAQCINDVACSLDTMCQQWQIINGRQQLLCSSASCTVTTPGSSGVTVPFHHFTTTAQGNCWHCLHSGTGSSYCRSFICSSMSFCIRCSSAFIRSLSSCNPAVGDFLSVLLCVLALGLVCLEGLLLSRVVLHKALSSLSG